MIDRGGRGLRAGALLAAVAAAVAFGGVAWIAGGRPPAKGHAQVEARGPAPSVAGRAEPVLERAPELAPAPREGAAGEAPAADPAASALERVSALAASI